MRIVLASSSQYRQKLLREMGFEFEVLAPEIDERAVSISEPERLARTLSEAKAVAVRERLQEPALILAADQVVTCGSELRGKPSSPAEARFFLESAGAAPAQTVSAVTALHTGTGQMVTGVDIVSIVLRPLPPGVIDRLLAEGEVFYCAGGLRIEDPLVQPYVDRLDGTLDSVMGLPQALTRRLMEQVSQEEK